MRIIRRGALVVTLKLSALLRYFNEALVNKAKKLQSSHTTNNLTVKALEDLGNDAEKFKQIALETAGSVSEIELREAVYLYFLTKQAASIYEAKIKYLPLQVYNEMRNALDHYFRALISEGGSRSSHIGKMEGHLQRAFLDITKLTCAASMEIIDRTHKRIGETSISLVNNGDYIKTITNLKVNAEETLIKAKLGEYSLGNGGESSVRDNYIEALAAHNLAYSFHKKNLGNLRWGRAKWLFHRPVGLIITILATFIAGYSVRVAWAASENLPIIKQIIDFVKNIAS
jgi:hypothetical protein